MQTIFFFYGLAFLVMGITIFLMPKKNDLLGLSEDLWLLGLFGLLHGMNEWVDMFILRGSPFNVEILTVLGALLLPLSFASLLQFGVQAIFRGTRSFRSLRYLWIIVLAGWAVACFLTPGFLISGIVVRYFICFPGTIVSAAALSQALLRTIHKENLPVTVSVGAAGAAALLVFYGILSGLVVPKAGFLLASFINYPNFLQVAGIPVQFFRMICAVLLAVSFFAMTGIYFYEPATKRAWRRGGIKRRIALLFCAVSCVIVLFTIGIVFAWVYRFTMNNIRNEQMEATRIISNSVGQMIQKDVEALEVHLSDRTRHGVVKEANARYTAMRPQEIQKFMRDTDRKWISAAPDSPLVKDFLKMPTSLRFKDIADQDLSIAEMFLTDRYGGIVAASGKTSDFYQADEDWWQKAYARGNGSIFIGDVELDQSTDILSVPIAVPIRDSKGAVMGVAKESLSVDIIFASLKSYHAGRSGHAALIDGKGNVIFHENMKPLSAKLFTEKEMLTFRDKETGLIRRVEENSQNVTFSTLERLDNPLLLKNGIEWYVCVSKDAEEIFLPLHILATGMAVLLLVILAVAVSLGIAVGNRFSKPIVVLQQATEKIVAGQWDYKVDIQTGDEIQEFAESFTEMVNRLRRRQSELLEAKKEIEAMSLGLEKKVEERTKDLSESQRATMNILEDLAETNKKLEQYTKELTRSKEEMELQSWGLQKANDGIKALYQELEKKNVDLGKLDRLKDDFVSIVAHELRNPLGIVREAAALILDGLVGPVDENQKKYIEMIKQTGDRLIHITTDLLDLAKIEAGKIVVNYEKLDLLSVARQACEGIALRAGKKGIAVAEDFPAGKVEISGDFDKLLQVMINLLSNAYKFTERGSIIVEVKDLGDEVRCAVKDTGPGISPENLKRLFSKFEQFGKPVISSEKGSGLGLVISKSIIEAHGGRMGAESELGKGTTVFFVLPKQSRQKKLGEILIEEKVLTPKQVSEALRKQTGTKF